MQGVEPVEGKLAFVKANGDLVKHQTGEGERSEFDYYVVNELRRRGYTETERCLGGKST